MENFTANAQEWLQSLDSTWAYVGIFLVLLSCGLGLPVPEDITLVTAGILVYEKHIVMLPTMVVCIVGVLAGDFILFFFGRYYKDRVHDFRFLKWFGFTPQRIFFAQKKLQQNQNLVCFTARFLAGLRAPIYLSAGVLGVRPRTFMIMDTLAALISVPLWVYGGWYFGEDIENIVHKMKPYIATIFGILVAGIVSYYFIKRRVVKPIPD